MESLPDFMIQRVTLSNYGNLYSYMHRLNVTFRSLSTDSWADFELLFGKKGASGGCGCMLWRLSPDEFEAQKGDGNRKAMQRLAESKISPGILAYDDDTAIGWCAIAPREEYPKLNASRILKPVDEKSVWSVSCFFINKAYRRKGVSVKLLNAAAEYKKS